MAFVCQVTWAQTGSKFYMRASTTSLSDGNYVLVAMNNHGTGPVIYDQNAGGRMYYRCENGTTLAAGDVVSSKYVWTIDVTNDGGVQHITVTNYDDNTKAFPNDGAKNLNFTGSGVASLKTEVKTIDGVDYIALSSKIDSEGNVVDGYIHSNTPGGNPCLSYWPAYGDGGTCVKFTFYPVDELVGESAPVVVTAINKDRFYTLQCKATDHGTFIKDNGTNINGRSSESSFFVFEPGTEANTYYIKSDVSGKYINADGKAVTVDAEKKTAWVLDTPSHSAGWVTFEDGTSDNFLNNNYTAGTPYLQANYHNGGPGSGNACSLWKLTEYTAEGKLLVEWKESVLPYLGRVGGYPADLRDEIEAVQTWAEKEAFEAAHEVLAINADTYYRLVCVSPKTGNGGNTSYNTLTFDGEGNLVTSLTDDENWNQLFQFEDAGNGKFYLKNTMANAYLNKIAAGSYRSKVVAKEEACKLSVSLHEGTAIQWRFHNSESSGHNSDKHCLFAENHPSESVPYACAGWDGGKNSASAWRIVPVNNFAYALTVSAAGYATLYLDCAVAIPENVEVYIAKTIQGDRLKMAKVEDVLPAETGVIVRAQPGRYGFVKSNETPVGVDGGLLWGTTTDEYITAKSGYKYYVLAKNNGVVGMYKAKLNEGEFFNNANKAYLPLNMNQLGIYNEETNTDEEGGQLSNRLRFDFGGTTSIQNPESRIQNSQIVYDLQGRRVENPTKGIYIVGGRKVVIK